MREPHFIIRLLFMLFNRLAAKIFSAAVVLTIYISIVGIPTVEAPAFLPDGAKYFSFGDALFMLIGGMISVLVYGVLFDGLNPKKQLGKISTAPGSTAVSFLQFLLPQKAYEEIFAQVIADMREEYFAALAEGHTKKARWIRLRDTSNLLLVIVQYLMVACLDRGMKIYKSFGNK